MILCSLLSMTLVRANYLRGLVWNNLRSSRIDAVVILFPELNQVIFLLHHSRNWVVWIYSQIVSITRSHYIILFWIAMLSRQSQLVWIDLCARSLASLIRMPSKNLRGWRDNLRYVDWHYSSLRAFIFANWVISTMWYREMTSSLVLEIFPALWILIEWKRKINFLPLSHQWRNLGVW